LIIFLLIPKVRLVNARHQGSPTGVAEAVGQTAIVKLQLANLKEPASAKSKGMATKRHYTSLGGSGEPFLHLLSVREQILNNYFPQLLRSVLAVF
jgi:hypothetical protein